MFQLAIIGHKEFYEKSVKGIPEEDLKNHVRFVLVNENVHDKNVPASFPEECIVKEYDIENYEPFYQKNNYYQNSFFFNLMNVIDTLGLDQIGFFQYDMVLTPVFDKIKTICESDSTAAIAFYPYPIEQLFEILNPPAWQFFIQQYSNFFNVEVDTEPLEKLPLALFHAFVIPKSNYCRMMHFTKKVLPNLITFLSSRGGNRHIAGTLERLFALFLNLEIVTKNMKDFTWVDGLIHDDVTMRLPDSFRGIS